MKKWQKNVAAILKQMGISREKVAAGNISAEEWKQIEEAYKTAHGKTLAEDKEAGEDADPDPDPEPEATAAQLSDEERTAIADMLGIEPAQVAQKPAAAAQQAAQAAQAARQQAEQMAHQPEVKKPVVVGAMKRANVFGGPHTATHLYGIEHELYSREKFYNQLTGASVVNESPRGEEVQMVQRDFLKMAGLVSQRLAQLREAGALASLTMASLHGEGQINMVPPTSELGEYLVRRTDAIIAYFKEVPSVRGTIFPVHSNVQNAEVAISAIVGELSQGYRAGRIFKGGMQFTPDKYKVDDLMFKFNFVDLVRLEKEYIGWLNRNEGSAIIKWTFIEWVLVHYGTQLIKEQSIRNVIGVRVPQQNVKANPSNLSADGALRAITRAIRQNRVLPFESIGTYDADTMLDTVEAFADEVVKAHGGLDDLKIYLNKRHQRWYIRAYREKYGKDADFTGANAQLVDLDPASLVWVPNMKENDFIMFAMEPGNIELLENKPGEMLAFDFTPEFEGVAVKSRWKEGSHATKAGAPFKSEADLKADNFEHQFLFVNNPASALTIAATVDLSGNTLFTISQAAGESPATAITTATGVATDRVITFVASAAGVTLEKSGVFSKISANFVAGAKGDYIEVYPELEDTTVTIDGESVTVTRPTGKLLELGRKVSA
jgi:hypothetical protein